MWPPKSERSWLSFSGPAAAVSLRAALSEAVQAAWGPAGGGCCLDDHPAVKYLARHGGVLPPKPVTLRARRSRTMRGITSSRRNRRFQQGEDLVLRASDDLGNILLSDALGIEWYLAILVAADRQASLDAGHPNRVPLDAGSWRRTRCRALGPWRSGADADHRGLRRSGHPVRGAQRG